MPRAITLLGNELQLEAHCELNFIEHFGVSERVSPTPPPLGISWQKKFRISYSCTLLARDCISFFRPFILTSLDFYQYLSIYFFIYKTKTRFQPTNFFCKKKDQKKVGQTIYHKFNPNKRKVKSNICTKARKSLIYMGKEMTEKKRKI
jgi:hypothetical protein